MHIGYSSKLDYHSKALSLYVEFVFTFMGLGDE